MSMRSALQSSVASNCCRHHDGPVMFLHTFRRKNFDWIPVDHAVEFMDELSARQWTNLIQTCLYNLPERPLHLFVVINPFGGSQKADSVWQEVVKPIFERANITCDAFRTGYRDHALDLLQQMPLEQFEGYSGIVAVGGDGLFQECLRGLLTLRSRGAAWAHKAATIRIAQVPAGSTDAVACTINGCRSPVTAALHVVLGDRAKVDVLEVRTQEGQCRYACSTASYGFIGDVLGASEHMRWMGPARYDVSGMMTFMNLRSYAVRLWYKVPHAPHRNRIICCSNCPVCSDPDPNQFDLWGPAACSGTAVCPQPQTADECASEVLSMTDDVSRRYVTNSDTAASDGKSVLSCAPYVNGSRRYQTFHMRGASGFDEQSVAYQRQQTCHKMPNEGNVPVYSESKQVHVTGSWTTKGQAHSEIVQCVDIERWHCWEGEVASLMIVVTPTRSDKSRHGIVPHAHLSDGRLHLVIVRRCTRWQFLRFLLSLTQGGVDETMSFVDVKEVEEWHCEELTGQQGSVWNVDGELLRSSYISARCHHGMVNVFGRGPEM